jgi:hypothetical protein
MTNIYADFAEQIHPILEICIGYKAKAVEAGLTEATAEQMAADLHTMLLTKITE